MSLELLSYLIRTVLIGVVAVALLLLLRRHSAGVQNVVAGSALIAMLALVPVSLLGPHSVPTVYSTPLPRALGQVQPTPPTFGQPKAVPPSPTTLSRSLEPVSIDQAVRLTQQTHAHLDPVVVFESVWMAGSASLALRLFFGLLAVGARVKRSRLVPLGTQISIREDEHAIVPLAVWWGRSLVMLPPSWSSWSPERLETVLQHETAHIHRGDCFIQLAANATLVAAWPNPLAWWLAAKWRSLSEQAVDDAILSKGISPSRYAQDLLDIAQESRDRLTGFALPMAIKPEVSKRIEMILNDQKQRGAATLAAITAMGIGFGGLAVAASTWKLVPEKALLKIEKSMPAPLRRMIERIDPRGYAILSSRTGPVPIEDPVVSKLVAAGVGKSSDEVLPAIQPDLPKYNEPKPHKADQRRPTDWVPTDSKSLRGTAKVELYTIDAKAELSRYGFKAIVAPTTGVGSYDFPPNRSSEVHRTLESLTATKPVIRKEFVGRDSTHTLFVNENGGRETFTFQNHLTVENSLSVSATVSLANEGKFKKMVFMMTLHSGETAVFTEPSKTSPDKLDVWALTPDLNEVDPDALLALGQLNVAMHVESFYVPHAEEAVKHPELAVTAKQGYREFNMSPKQLSGLHQLLQRLGSPIDRPITNWTREGTPATSEEGGKDVGRDLSLTISRDRKLKVKIYELSAKVEWERNYLSESPLPVGISRVIIRRPDANTGKILGWIITVDPPLPGQRFFLPEERMPKS